MVACSDVALRVTCCVLPRCAVLQPVSGDWRKRFKGASSSSDTAAAEPAVATASQDGGPSSPTKSSKPSKPDKLAKSKAAKASAASAKQQGGSSRRSAAAAAETVYPTHSVTKPDLDALSKALPPGWRAMWDKKTGDIYYGNPGTKVRRTDVGS